MGIRRVELDESFKAEGVQGDAVQKARTLALKKEIPLRQALLETEGINESAMARAFSNLSGLPVVESIELANIQVEHIRILPHNIARENGVLPLYVDADGQLVVGMADLQALAVLDDLRVLYGLAVRPVIVPVKVLAEATQQAYDKAASSAEAIIEKADDDVEDEADLALDAELLDDPNQAPIIRFVNAVLTQAIKERASDIHIEPYEKDLVVRYRVDGVL
jgi:general secretion pathway protein E